MCPERQILSVYLDGELPSPWKEKMESHVASCPACRETLESWKRMCGTLREDDDPRRGERVWERIDSRIAAAKTTERIIIREEAFRGSSAGYPERFWRRNVTLPFPAAAALGAAAAAAFVFIFSSLWLRSPTGGASPSPDSAVARLPIETAGLDLELTHIRPVSDMSGVLQYLESTDSNDIVISRLPESRNFQSAGEPKIIKAADYSPRRLPQ
jgi:hypothetical protein